MNNKLAEALGIRFCQTCNQEITKVDYEQDNGMQYIMHDSAGFFAWETKELEQVEQATGRHYTGYENEHYATE